MPRGLIALSFILFFTFSLQSQGWGTSGPQLSIQEKEMVTLFYDVTCLATRTERTLGKTHVATTILTKKDIERSGARTIEDLLRLVPGIQVGISPVGYPRLYLRGLPSQGTEKIKILLNGIDLSSALTGGAAFFLDHFPVYYVEKVEAIRGPGSSLYGSDALAGVINIITVPEVVDHSHGDLGASYGSWDSEHVDGRFLYPLTQGYALGAAHYFHSNGADVHVSKDILGRSGHTNEAQERSDLSLTIKKGPFSWGGYYMNYFSGGYYNPGFYLTDKTRTGWEDFWTHLTYERSFLNNLLDIKENIFFNRHRHNFDIDYRPPGWKNRRGVPYPYGIKARLLGYMDHYGSEFVANLRPWNGHTFTLGLELRQSELHGVSIKANYDPRPLPRVMDVTERFNWILPEDRFFWGGFLQYQWDLNDSSYLVGGVRYDQYDDVGDVISPNLGLFWCFKRDWSLAIHYSKGFRAPAFRELYKLPPGPPITGNPDLKPEESQSIDTTISWRPRRAFSFSVTGFYSEVEDLILGQDRRFQNVGNLWVRGVEITAKVETNRLHMRMNQAYVKSQMNDRDFTGISNWIGTAFVSYELSQRAWVSSVIYFVGSVDVYSPLSQRVKVDDYTTIDLIFGLKHLFHPQKGPDLSIAIRNLLDEDVSFPDVTGVVSEGLKRPGISLDARLSFSF